MSDEIRTDLIRCEICALAHDPRLGQCTGDVDHERGYRSGYDRGQAEQQQEIQRLRTVIASYATIEVASMKAEIERLQVELQSSRVAARGLADECDRQREQIAAMRQIHDEDPA